MRVDKILESLDVKEAFAEKSYLVDGAGDNILILKLDPSEILLDTINGFMKFDCDEVQLNATRHTISFLSDMELYCENPIQDIVRIEQN